MRSSIKIAILFLAGTLATSGQSPTQKGVAAFGHMEALSAIGPRVAGTENERRAAAYIEDAFRRAGYEPENRSFDIGRRGESANVVAFKRGLSDREIIVGAHYDSQSRGPGADDNGSGVGVLLEVAAALADVRTPYTVRFVAFGAEEGGLRGARNFVSMMSAEEVANTVAMVNVDSVTAGDYAYVYGNEGESGRIRDWVLAQATAAGLDLETQSVGNPEYPPGTTCDCSDHAPFEAAGIQYAYFESTNWALGDKDGYTQVDPSLGEDGMIWHTPYDTIGYIEESFPGRIARRLELFSTMLYRVLTEYQE